MKASRAAIKAANNLEELAGQIVLMREQLDRIEAMLIGTVLVGTEEEKLPVKEKAKTGK